MMYPRFQKVVEKIIEKYSEVLLEEFYTSESKTFKIKKQNYMDFTLEKQGDFLYVGYYRRMNGDSISDPIFIFQIKDRVWYPVAVEQVVGRSEVGEFTVQGEYEHYPSRFAHVRTFANACAKEWQEYYL